MGRSWRGTKVSGTYLRDPLQHNKTRRQLQNHTYSTFWSTWIHGYIETPNDVTSDNISRFHNAFKSTIYYPEKFLNVFSKNEKL